MMFNRKALEEWKVLDGRSLRNKYYKADRKLRRDRVHQVYAEQAIEDQRSNTKFISGLCAEGGRSGYNYR